MGDFENVVQCYEQYLKIVKDLGNKREEVRVYSNLGSVYYYRRNFDKVMFYYNYVLELAQELMEKVIEMRVYVGLGYVVRCMQDLERVKQYYEQQLGIVEDFKDRVVEGRAFFNLGKDRIVFKIQGLYYGLEMSWSSLLFFIGICVFVFKRIFSLCVLYIFFRYIFLEFVCCKLYDFFCYRSVLRIRILKYWKNKIF